MIAPYEVLI